MSVYAGFLLTSLNLNAGLRFSDCLGTRMEASFCLVVHSPHSTLPNSLAIDQPQNIYGRAFAGLGVKGYL